MKQIRDTPRPAMTKEGLIKQLEELRDTKDYSQSKLMNTGYRTGLLDALDLVNKYFDTSDKPQNSNDFIADFRESFNYDEMKTIVPYYIMDLGNELACNELRFIVKTFLQQNEDYRLEVERLHSI